MARRTILTVGEPRLNKKSRPVTEFNERLHVLLDDMAETLLAANGVGLAAPQVGVLRRAVIVLDEMPDEEQPAHITEFVNPEILYTEGEQAGPEGCLSVPDVTGYVVRPAFVRVKAQDRNGEWFEVEYEDLNARCICHEVAHLEGQLFTEVADHIMTAEELQAYQEEMQALEDDLEEDLYDLEELEDLALDAEAAEPDASESAPDASEAAPEQPAEAQA